MSLPRPDHTCDQSFSEELQFKRENGLFESPPIPKKPFIILLIVLLGLLAAGAHLIIIGGVAIFGLFILAVNQINREGDSITAPCPTCSKQMEKQEQSNREYFICHHCKIYAIGRDSQ